ncbi:type II toxin-antitoxin system RelE/ParE family toxin [Bacterioplanoides sp.]|uniref:type II toxin-antitoxin system RelE/ParE family toxin n=1 Tax=Bacterioplanoides sp. TaxID=2066072 RepID=UPI003B007FA5
MIVSFQHKGLKAFYETGNTKGIQAKHAKKLREILTLLDVASSSQDLQFHWLKLHRLSGQLEGYYSVWVNGNWRITFRFISDDVELVNYVDYH